MNKILFQIAPYVIILLLALYILNTVFKKVGLKESKETKKIKKGATNIVTSKYFNPSLHKNTVLYRPLGVEMAGHYAKELRQAVNWWGTDEALIFSTFRKLFNKMNISQVSDRYEQMYDEDLRSRLINELSEYDLGLLNTIIEKLPDVN